MVGFFLLGLLGRKITIENPTKKFLKSKLNFQNEQLCKKRYF